MINADFNKLKNDFDINNIFDSISSFGSQINESFSIMDDCLKKYSNNFKEIRNKKISSVLICGMGGSAIGGELSKIALSKDISVPIIINRSADIPNWVNKETLVIVSSYSGNTYETIQAYKQSKSKTNLIIIIASCAPSKLNDFSRTYNHIKLDIPSGIQPRCALGYSSSIITMLFMNLNLIDSSKSDALKSASNLLNSAQLENLKDICSPNNNPAILLASKIQNQIPIIYGSEDFSSIIALRFQNQLQENSKLMAFSNNYPEINHNEIEGWSSSGNYFVIWLSDEEGLSDVFNSAQKLINQLGVKQISIDLKNHLAKIENRLEILYASIYFFDWVSYYLALLQNQNPCSIDNIKYIKQNNTLL